MNTSSSANQARKFSRRALPWTVGALAPVISSRTVQFHYECHHKAYVQTANRLLRGRAELDDLDPLDIVEWARRRPAEQALFNAAAQACNHAFFWNSLTPLKMRPSGQLGVAMADAFGSYDEFANEFATHGTRHFGSGWLWLVADKKRQLQIQTTDNADRPERARWNCLLTIDLWEHSYYLDHQDRRREYLDAVIDRRLNWNFAADQFRSGVRG